MQQTIVKNSKFIIFVSLIIATLVLLFQPDPTQAEVVQPAPAAQASVVDPAELEAFMDAYLTEQMAAHHIPGAVITVVKDGKVYFSKGYGYADVKIQTPFDPDQTVLTTASLGKAFTAVAVLQLAEQGLIDLHEDVRPFEEARERGIMDERQRLAAEIHDGLTQGFISIVTHLEVAEARLETYPPEVRNDLQGPLDQARQTARDNLTASRQMVWALRPDLQAGTPLADALAEVTDRWATANNIAVTFSTLGAARQLHPDLETVMLRTTREALNNVAKHAEADQVTVTLTYLDTLVALDVQDNGHGFGAGALSTMPADSGFGLKSMHVQAERMGGEFSVESVPAIGTTIGIVLPVT